MIAVLSGRFYIRLSFKDSFKPDRDAISQITKIGLPSMMEQLVMRTGMIIYNRAVAGLGTVSFAAHQILFNIQAMSFMTGQAFAVSATSLVGQSLGRRRPDMAHLYSARTRRIGMVFAVFLGVTFFFFGRQIIGLYTYDPYIIDIGGEIMMLMAFILPLQSSQFILAGALRGAGDTRATAIITFVSVLLVRPFMAIGLIELFHLGLWGAWIALMVDQMLRSLLVWLRFNSGKWKTVIKG
jgi:putative MATE family efflux protein